MVWSSGRARLWTPRGDSNQGRCKAGARPLQGRSPTGMASALNGHCISVSPPLARILERSQHTRSMANPRSAILSNHVNVESAPHRTAKCKELESLRSITPTRRIKREPGEIRESAGAESGLGFRVFGVVRGYPSGLDEVSLLMRGQRPGISALLILPVRPQSGSAYCPTSHRNPTNFPQNNSAPSPEPTETILEISPATSAERYKPVTMPTACGLEMGLKKRP
jgi:hypothetical protein